MYTKRYKKEEERERGKERKREIKTPGFPAYPLSLQLCSYRFKPAWERQLLLLGMVLGPYAGP